MVVVREAKEMKIYYKRQLPHIQPPGATLFVTFRLAGSLPKAVIVELKRKYDSLNRLIAEKKKLNQSSLRRYERERNRVFVTYDRYLDTTTSGPQFLKDKRVAKMICTAMLHLDNLKYELLAFCVMSNHVHLVFTPLRMDTGEYHSLAEIMHSIKSYTASEANRILGRKGTPFWQHESFDHFCRDEKDVEWVIEYTVNNPVRAGLVDKAEDWPWSYVSS